MEHVIKKAARVVGLDNRRLPKKSGQSSTSLTLPSYHSAILALLSAKKNIRTVVIGANDGKHNDPLYTLLTEKLSAIMEIILFEPQKSLIPVLHEHYQFYKNYRVINCAIGSGLALKLFSVRPEYWNRMQPDYAADWPIYRAPTGVTSFCRDNVAHWVRKFLRPGEAVQDVLEENDVPCHPLVEALMMENIECNVDVIQVDTEGYDDEVLFCCEIEKTRPSVIRYEAKLLSEIRLTRLSDYLKTCGYTSRRDGVDMMCFRVDI